MRHQGGLELAIARFFHWHFALDYLLRAGGQLIGEKRPAVSMPAHGLAHVSSFAIALVLVTFSANGAGAERGLPGRKMLDTNLAAGDVDVSCDGLAPVSILRSVQVRSSDNS